MKKIFLLLGALALVGTMHAKSLTLDLNKSLNPEEFVYDANDVWTETYNEEDYYTIDFSGFSFAHNAWTDYDFWYGFTVAKAADTTYAQLTDQFHCVAGGGLAGKGTPYILAYAAEGWGPTSPCEVYFTTDTEPWLAEEVYLCIGSWAMDNVLKGGGAARAFAEGDSLVVEIEGLDENAEIIAGKKVTFFLADYRSADQSEWYLNRAWEKCDLTALGEVYGLVFTMKSSDQGGWGANTALYFAMDGLKISRNAVATFENEDGGINLTTAESNWFGADEPVEGWNSWKSGDYNFQTYYSEYYKSAWVVTNETSTDFEDYNDAYRSACGGSFEGDNFAVWNLCYYGDEYITFEPQVVPGFFVNNSIYAVHSMSNGDSFAKKFDKDDWFKLTITGLRNNDATGSVEFYLASDGKYVNWWTYVDLSSLGEIDAVSFTMSSTDTGDWGMNTPAYFAMDNFGAMMPEGYVEPERVPFDGSESAIDNTHATVKATKVVRDGQVLIIREGKSFNILGTQL